MVEGPDPPAEGAAPVPDEVGTGAPAEEVGGAAVPLVEVGTVVFAPPETKSHTAGPGMVYSVKVP